MKKRIQKYISLLAVSALIFTCSLPSAFAQGSGYFNHQYLQPILINVGATGFQGDHQLLAGYRHAWSDFPASRSARVGDKDYFLAWG